MKATITTKKYVARDTLEVTLRTAQPVHFSVGQAMLVTLPKLTFQDAKGPRRFFSIVCMPNEHNQVIFTTRLRQSAFKQTLIDLPVGTELEILLTGGKFVLPEDATIPLVFIAGGIGVTPFMSMLRQLDSSHDLNDVTLLYSNRQQEDAAYLEELQVLAHKRSGFRLIPIMTTDASWSGETRRIDKAILSEYVVDHNQSSFYVSGSDSMVRIIRDELIQLDIAEAKIVADVLMGY